uniref:EamA domain-containing protein n=1 Tax=viral metagenome TaxID=1070528 RepID=A0A6M3KLE9_9ZZZZ
MHWIIAAGLSGLAYAVWAFCLRAGTASHNWKQVLFFAAVAEMLVILVYAWPKTAVQAGAVGWGLGAGLAAVVGYILIVYALSVSSHSMPVVVSHIYPALAVVMAFIILHEPMSLERWLGVALTTAGIWLVVK